MTPDTADSTDRRQLPRKVAIGLIAMLAAILLAQAAPSNWEQGEGATRLELDGAIVLEALLIIGSTDAVTFTASAGGTDIIVTYPGGVPVAGLIEAAISFPTDPERIQQDIGNVVLQVVLPDGQTEVIPIVRWDEPSQSLVAMRRPPQDAAVVLGILGLVVVLWVTEAVPLFVAALLIPVVLIFSGVATANAATAPFSNPIIVLFFAGFLLAEAMKRTNLDHHIAVSITAAAGASPAMLYGTMIGLAAVLSMFMSNTAAAAALVPIAIAITAPLDEDGYQKALVLGIAYAATIGGVGSAIGTPANQIAIEFLDGFADRTISFAEWFAFGLPMVLLFLPIMGWYLWQRSDIAVDQVRFSEAQRVAKRERNALGRPTRDQILVLSVFAVVAIGWLTETFHGVHAGIVALAGAIALFALGKLLPEDLGRISWPSLITFGGGLTLGLFIVEAGVSDYLATRLAGVASAPTVVAIFVVALITLLVTTVASNTASAAILIPIAIPLAAVLGVSPTTLVVVVAMASSIDFALVVGTPPTMVAYSTRLFTAGQIFRKGIVLDLIGVSVLVLFVAKLWELIGLT